MIGREISVLIGFRQLNHLFPIGFQLQCFRIVGVLREAVAEFAFDQIASQVRPNYFCLGPVSTTYRALDRHARKRLRWWLCGKHKQRGRGITRFPDAWLHQTMGLKELSVRTRDLPWAKA
jgi:hypothetical protein